MTIFSIRLIFPSRLALRAVGSPLILLGFVLPLLFGQAHASGDDDSGSRSWLHLAGGEHLAGTLVDLDSKSPDSFGWQHPQFDKSLEFSFDRVQQISFADAGPAKFAAGSCLVELMDGDRVVGKVSSITPSALQLESEEFGELAIDFSSVRYLRRLGDDQSIRFVGPGDVRDWRTEGEKSDWANHAGKISTKKSGASIYRDVSLPDHSIIDIELSWTGKPNFIVAFGVSETDLEKTTRTAFRLEVWEDDLLVLCERGDLADFAALGKIDRFEGRLSARLELDQTSGTMIMQVMGDKSTRKRLKLPSKGIGVHPAIGITNVRGSVSLDSVRVIEIAGPIESKSDQAAIAQQQRFVLKDGTQLIGQWTGVKDEAWTIQAEEEERTINLNEIVSAYFETGETSDSGKTTPEAEANSPLRYAVMTNQGSELTGTDLSVSDGSLTFTSTTLNSPLSIPIASVNRVIGMDTPAKQPADDVERPGRLESDEMRLAGELVVTESDWKPTPIRFRPNGSNIVTLQPSFAGRLVYKDPPPEETEAVRRKRKEAEFRQEQLMRAQVRNANGRDVPRNVREWLALAKAREGAKEEGKELHLRSGEVIPGEILSIDEQSVRFRSPMIAKDSLPADQMRAVKLLPRQSLGVDAKELDRLLTVPRVVKKYPPTHLLIATNGDLLRCRLIRLTDKIAEVETRLNTLEIDRSLITEIIWLETPPPESDETESDGPEAAASEIADAGVDQQASPAIDTFMENGETAPRELTIRAKLKNGNQFSMVPANVTDEEIFGTHPHLGASTILLDETDELVFGVYESPAITDPFEQWKLSNAVEPTILEGEGGGRDSGMASKLVGTEAPDFALELLDGGKFRVSEHRGKVLVLDFWASWCGPCLRAMPVIDSTVAEFDESEVMLVAVNVQEATDPIHKTLARLEIQPRVVMDIDGVAATRYEANAIPQTVVIDAEGIITRVFVGSSDGLADNLREAIEQQIATP